MNRKALLEDLKSYDGYWDFVVIGGGATGLIAKNSSNVRMSTGFLSVAQPGMSKAISTSSLNVPLSFEP